MLFSEVTAFGHLRAPHLKAWALNLILIETELKAELKILS